MNVKTMPASRFGWEGQTLEYTVKADDASEIAVAEDLPDGVNIRILDTRRVADGVEARVAVDVIEPVFY